MNYYNAEKVNEHITAIRSLTGEILYLIEGEERAALIDTCLGVGHLKEFTAALTQKPIIVLLTHGHVDHALGAPEFDRVYMNKKDIEVYKAMAPLEERKGYMRAGLPDGVFDQIQEEDFVPPAPEKEFWDLEDGMVFDLGGIHIEAAAYPGHTQGSMAFLVQEERVLILGDACNNSTFLFVPGSDTVEKYRDTTVRVAEKTKGRYDRVFISHQQMETGRDIMENMISLCSEIMEGNADDIPFEFMGMKACVAKKCNERFERLDGKCGNLIYCKERIWKEQQDNEI